MVSCLELTDPPKNYQQNEIVAAIPRVLAATAIIVALAALIVLGSAHAQVAGTTASVLPSLHNGCLLAAQWSAAACACAVGLGILRDSYAGIRAGIADRDCSLGFQFFLQEAAMSLLSPCLAPLILCCKC